MAAAMVAVEDTRFSRSPALQRMLGGQEEVALGLSSQAGMMESRTRSRGRSQRPRGRSKDAGNWSLPQISTAFSARLSSTFSMDSAASSQATSPYPEGGTRKRNAKRMKWTKEEDEHMLRLITQHGLKQWNVIAAELPGRTGKQCRERWHNQLDPSLKRGPWSVDEENVLIAAHAKHGNKWSDIAAMLPGRTDNSIKNHWNSAKRRLMRYLFGNADEAEGQDGRGQKRSLDAVDGDDEEAKGLKYRRKRPRALDIFAKMQVPVPSPLGSNNNGNVSVSDLLDDSAMMGMVLGSTRLSTEKLMQALTHPPSTDVSDAASCLKALQTSALPEAPDLENAGEAAAKLIAASPTPPAFIAKLDISRSAPTSGRVPAGHSAGSSSFDFVEACARLERRQSSLETVKEDLDDGGDSPCSPRGAMFDANDYPDDTESPMEILAQACMPAEKRALRSDSSARSKLVASNSIDTSSDSVESKTDTEGRADCESLTLSEA